MTATRKLFLGLTLAYGLCLPIWTQAVLEDQFGKKLDPGAMTGARIIVASDLQATTGRVLAWEKALKAAGVLTPVLGISDLRGLPFFIPKSAILSSLAKDAPATSILLDWKGVFATAQSLGKNRVTVLVYGSDGRLAYRTEGDPEPASVTRISAILP